MGSIPITIIPGGQGTITETWNDSSESHADYYTAMEAFQNVNTLSSKAIFKSELSYYDQFEAEHSWQIYRYWNSISNFFF